MPPSVHRIAVIGCGIAGPMVATLLAQQGHIVTLFEQAPELRPVGAGIMLQPLGQWVLAKLGLLDEVIRNAEPIREIHAIQRSGKTLIRMPFSMSGLDAIAYGVHRNDIFQALISQAKMVGVRMQLNTNLANTYVHRDRKSANVDLIDASGGVYPGFDHVILSSGSRTSLRNISKFKLDGYAYNHGAVWFNASSDLVQGKLLQVVRGSRNLMGMLPVGQGRLSFFWGLPCRDMENFMSQSLDQWKSQLVDFYPECALMVDSIQSREQAACGTYMNAVVQPVFDEHHLFIGDAAHSMSPHLGQGMNFALLDAYRFAAAFAEHQDWLAACQKYVHQQSSHLRYYRTITGLLAPFFQSDSTWRGPFRDVMLPWFHRLPWIRQQMGLTMTGLKGGFLKGPIDLDAIG